MAGSTPREPSRDDVPAPQGSPPADEERPSEFEWGSPRWREADPPADADERTRRFRDQRAPDQRGAIDAGGSVPRGKGSDTQDEVPEA